MTFPSVFMFQFLIGWLQTEKEEPRSGAYVSKFQFLIGWLQTHDTARLELSTGIVSIPYRLATNADV